MWFLLLTPIIETALLKTWLKVERFSLQFINLNLLRTKRKEDWTFWGSPFSVTIWLPYVIVRWLDQGPNMQYLLWNINYNFRFKIQPKIRPNFFSSQKNISCALCTPQISFLNALSCVCLNSRYRAVAKTSSCRVYANSRRGIVELGTSLVSVFLLFPMKVAGSHAHGNRGKYPVPSS